MKNTIEILVIIITALLLMLGTSCLLDINWVNSHWVRQFIVLLLIFLELISAILMLIEKAKRIKT